MVAHLLKREFKLTNLFYNYPNERVFYCCQWQWPRIVFVVIRVALALYVIFGLTDLIIDYYSHGKEDNSTDVRDSKDDQARDKPIVVFFTVWSYIMLLLHFVLAAVLCGVFYRRAGVHICEVKFQSVVASPVVPTGTELLDTNTLAPDGTHATHVSDTPGRQLESSIANDSNNPRFTSSSAADTAHSRSDSDANTVDKTLMAPEEMHSPEDLTNVAYKAHSTYESFNRFHTHAERSKTAWYFKLSWVLSDIASIAAPIVTVIFFTALYPRMAASKTSGLDLQNTNVHALNLVFVQIDHLISARPIRLLHVAAPLIYGAVYIIFSVIYWSTDKTNHVLYPGVLDWNYPGVAAGVTLGLALVAIPLLQLFYFGIYLLKDLVHKKIYGFSFDGEVD